MSNREDDKIEVYMTSVAQNIFGDRLSGIVGTDSYLRQPDYSARTADHYYIVLSNGLEREDVLAIRYMRCEFPSCFFNFVYEGELGQYPAHGIWQFSCSPWLFRKAAGKVPMRERDLVDETRQAIFAAYHLSRLYFIRKLDLKTHIWGVRQFGWAVRYASQCLAASFIPPEPGLDAQDIADRDWLIDLQNNWGRYEHAFSNSQDAFRDAAAKLSDIAGRRAEALQNANPAEALMPSKETDPISGIMVPIVRRVHDCLAYEMGPSLLSFYLHGSAARGDMRPDSDIDSFVIVNRVTRQTLDIARKIQADNPPFTISVYGQAEINQYPNFRRYALANGTKLVGGDHRLDFTFNPSDDIAGVINNIFTVRQVIRSYLIEGSYGQRAHYVAGLMAKLIDHGGLRPVQKLVSGSYPTSRAAVRAYFSESTACGRVLDHVDALNSNEQLMRESLFKGFNEPLEDLFFALLQATSWIEARLAV